MFEGQWHDLDAVSGEFLLPGKAHAIQIVDNGTSIGAAFYVWNQILKQPRSFVLEHAYWGSEFSDTECLATLQQHPELKIEKLEQAALLETTANALCAGQVVGWFQGRMEFGARALGNRSLLADPRRVDMPPVWQK